MVRLGFKSRVGLLLLDLELYVAAVVGALLGGHGKGCGGWGGVGVGCV